MTTLVLDVAMAPPRSPASLPSNRVLVTVRVDPSSALIAPPYLPASPPVKVMSFTVRLPPLIAKIRCSPLPSISYPAPSTVISVLISGRSASRVILTPSVIVSAPLPAGQPLVAVSVLAAVIASHNVHEPFVSSSAVLSTVIEAASTSPIVTKSNNSAASAALSTWKATELLI